MPPTPSRHRNYRHRIYLHFVRATLLAAAGIVSALGLGVLGYHFIAGFGWVDAVLDAAMILSGMGPVGTLESDGAKLFAAGYALFSGVVFISASGILIAPMFHWVLHRFHVEDRDCH